MRTRFLSVFAAGISVATQAFAGAWTQDAGKGQAILNGWYYATDELYNNSGNKASQPDYTKYELNPYIEYGLLSGVTIGANLSLQRAQQDISTGGDVTNYGIGDSEFFARFRVWQQNGVVVSLEPLIKLPSPESGSDTPALGGRHPDAGLGISAGYGFSMYGQNHFANLDAGYRYRFGDPENQARYAGTLGIGINDRWMVMPQAFLTYRTDSPAVATFTQSSGDDFNLVKLQLSAVYKINDAVALQVGGFSHVDGKNVGAGNGALFSVWKKF